MIEAKPEYEKGLAVFDVEVTLGLVVICIVYLVTAALFFKLYPFMMSRADFFRTSPFNYWTSRLFWTFFGPPITAWILVALLSQLFQAP